MAVNAEKAANSIPVDTFKFNVDDFDEWIDMFENAVILATNVTEEERKKDCFKRWLPLKLDAQARSIYGNCKKTAWDDLKSEFKQLLVDPQERYNWRAGHSNIVWDGKESFHALGTRVKRKVDKYEDARGREQEYFFQFRKALPKNYRKAIDLGSGTETLEEAKRIAFRVQMADADKDDSDPVTDDQAGSLQPGKSVSFTGASMSDDRLKSIELSLQGLTVQVGNIDNEVKKVANRVNGKDDVLMGLVLSKSCAVFYL